MRTTRTATTPNRTLRGALLLLPAALFLAGCTGTTDDVDLPTPSAVAEAARKALATELDLPEADLDIAVDEAVTWPDTSIGCPEEGMSYAQVLTPGHRVILRVGYEEYAFHAAEGGLPFLCENPQEPVAE